MGARQPRKQPATVESAVKALKATLPTIDAELSRAPAPPSDGIPYASLRLKSNCGKMRYSNNSLLVEATDDQTITLYGEKVAPSGVKIPFVHYKVMPSGVEIPTENVTGAIPADASIVDKLSRTGRSNKRAEAVAKMMAAKTAENEQIAARRIREQGGGTIQEVPEEDDDLDESDDTEGESDAEGDDGIDV